MDQVVIIKRQFKLINRQLIDNYPHETGGFFGGRNNVILGVFPIANINQGSRARSKFSINENDIYMAQNFFKDNKLQIMGMYHSHPNGAPIPSQQDMSHLVGDNFGRYHLIVSVKPHNILKKKFKIQNNEPAYQIRTGLFYCPSARKKIPVKLKMVDNSAVDSYLLHSSGSNFQHSSFYHEYKNLENKIYQMITKGKIKYDKEQANLISNSNFNIDT